MSTMERAESAKRLDENLKRAVSRCNELALALKQPLFFQCAKSIDGIRRQCMQIATAKGRSKTEINSDIDILYGKMAEAQEPGKQETLH